MSTIKNTLFLIGHFTLGQIPWFNALIRIFYLRLFIPGLEFFLGTTVIARHSVLQASFCAFISDLDVCLVVNNDLESERMIKKFLQLKKIFIMLDYPEIYTTTEYEHLKSLKKRESSALLINFCWHLRKMSWSNECLKKARHPFLKYKYQRSIKNSQKKTGTKNNILCLNELSALRELIPYEHCPSELCYYSAFTETQKNGLLILEMTREQFPFFNSLMPGDQIDPWIAKKINETFIEAKLALATSELYLSRSVLRLKKAMNEESPEHKLWCDLLEKNIRECELLKAQLNNA